MQYTVYYDQFNRTNFQVKARNEEEALKKAMELYKKQLHNTPAYIEEGWIVETDGEDK